MNDLKHHLNWEDFEFQVLYYRHGREYNIRDRHSHDDFYELVVVREGSAFHGFGGEKHRLSPGDVFLMPPGEPHYYTDANRLGIYNILFSRKFFSGVLAELRDAAEVESYLGLVPAGIRERKFEIRHLDNRLFFQITALLDEILAEEREKRSGARLMVLSNALRVLLLICRYAKKSAPADDSADYRIGMLIRRLDTEYPETWSLERMAETTGFPVDGFRHRFRRIVGAPPMAWLLELRLEKAELLLRTGTLSVAETAAACGFTDSNYFSRQFRRKFGRTPRESRSR